MIGVNMWRSVWNSRHTIFEPCKRMHLRVEPDMALSRLDVYPAAHCIIRPILLFRKWEDISRAIIGVNMWSECVEFSPHHFRAAQAHAFARRPGHGAESPLATLQGTQALESWQMERA